MVSRLVRTWVTTTVGPDACPGLLSRLCELAERRHLCSRDSRRMPGARVSRRYERSNAGGASYAPVRVEQDARSALSAFVIVTVMCQLGYLWGFRMAARQRALVDGTSDMNCWRSRAEVRWYPTLVTAGCFCCRVAPMAVQPRRRPIGTRLMVLFDGSSLSGWSHAGPALRVARRRVAVARRPGPAVVFRSELRRLRTPARLADVRPDGQLRSLPPLSRSERRSRSQ